MAAVNDWWSSDLAERYWLVNEKWGGTDDEAVIIAARYKRNGRPSNFSSLCEFVNVGDVVVHYSTVEQAILWCSEVTSECWTGWLDKEYAPFPTDDDVVPAVGFDFRVTQHLRRPISLRRLRGVEDELLALRNTLLNSHGRSIYFPWLFYGQQQRLRPAQMYLTKLPAAAATILERLGGFTI